MSDLAQWMAPVVARTEVVFECALPAEAVSSQRLHVAMRHVTLGMRKRARPLSAHAASVLGDVSSEALDDMSCAVEVIHVYSLVHDDMSCMDDDDLRRGCPTIYRVYDEATALLAGGALQTQAPIVLAEQGVMRPAMCAVLIGELARVPSSQGMAGGQAIDLQSIGTVLPQDELKAMHRVKADVLLWASLRMGALCAEVNAAALEHVDAYMGVVDLAFQVVDDILDMTADTATLSRTVDKDEANDKPAYVSTLGLDETRALTDELHVAVGVVVTELAREIGREANRARTVRLVEIVDLIVWHGHWTTLRRRWKSLSKRLSGGPA